MSKIIDLPIIDQIDEALELEASTILSQINYVLDRLDGVKTRGIEYADQIDHVNKVKAAEELKTHLLDRYFRLMDRLKEINGPQ